METITFTPKGEICKGFRFLAIGLKHIAKGLCAAYDNSLHKYPYVHLYLLVIIGSLTTIFIVGNARSERDSLSKQNYKLREQIDSIQNIYATKKVRTIYGD